jgi:hypothetical protein
MTVHRSAQTHGPITTSVLEPSAIDLLQDREVMTAERSSGTGRYGNTGLRGPTGEASMIGTKGCQHEPHN